MILASVAVSRLIDKSIATGMMGLMLPVYSVPIVSLAFVLEAVFLRYVWPPFCHTPARRVGRNHIGCPWRMDTGADQWHYRRCRL
jgi:hypothetical protein